MKRRSKKTSPSVPRKARTPEKLRTLSANAAGASPASPVSVASVTKPSPNTGYPLRMASSKIRTALPTTKQVKTEAGQPASIKTAVSKRPLPVKEPSQSQQAKTPSIKSRAVDEATKKMREKERTCAPSPEPISSSGGGSGRSFVPWEARDDLPCRRK